MSRRKAKTTEQVIREFRKVHGNKYDYSQLVYTIAHSKVSIVCPEHGVFLQTPANHNYGFGCPQCAGNVRPSTEEFIARAKEIHGDKYDYSRVNYVDAKTKVRIICPLHGEFLQLPNSHLKGYHCEKCSYVERGKARIEKAGKKFVERARETHGNRYDYSHVEYVRATSKVKIVCLEHGEFEQTPNSHLNGNGCPTCAGTARSSTSEFVERAKRIHAGKYDYSLVDYLNARTNVKIICPLHGTFEQTPSMHLNSQGCPRCAGNMSLTKAEFIAKANERHDGKYDYSQVEYSNVNSKVVIMCPLHGAFEQRADAHMGGQGCPTCNLGWTKSKILDFVNSIDNHDLLHMDAIELQAIINQGKLPDALNVLVFSDDANRDNTLKALKEQLQEHISKGRGEEEGNPDVEAMEPVQYIESDEVEEADIAINESASNDGSTKEPTLISLSNKFDDLHVLDNPIVSSCDEEAVEFLIQYKLRKLWNKVLNEQVDVSKLKTEQGGSNFNLLKSYFFDEYDEVIAYQPPQGYQFPYKLNAMQQLTVFRMIKNRRYGNWSGTGAGKTISFIVSSRQVNARLTVLVGLNSTIKQLGEAIVEVFPDSKVFARYQKGYVYDRAHHNYLILNYDKFQQKYSEGLYQDLTANNIIDFIAIDEVHNVKQRTEQEESIRRGTLKRLIGRAGERNPNLYVLGMSATPVINNLTEAKSLLEMITGKEYEDLNTRRTLTNALEVFKHMTLNGLRYIPKYKIVIRELDGSNTSDLKIDGTHLLEKLLKVGNQNYLGAERLLLKAKLGAIQPYLKKGVVVFSYFTEKMIKPIVEYLTGLGYRVATFTGSESMDEREENKEGFLHGRIDILVGSRPIGTGVDGLQKVCNRMIILSLPWTDSEYTQLKGRIYRQGSKFGEVEVIVPQVYIPLEDREWSWDVQRMNLIRNKKTLADAAVDGVIPSKHLPRPETLFKKSQEALKEWKDRVNEGKVFHIDRKDLVFPLHPEVVEQIGRQIGDFSEVNRVWSVSKSSTTHKRLKEHPEDWYYYHTLYTEKRKTWDEIPYIEIAKKIVRTDFVVADLGCGENLLRKEIPENTVLAFDHVAIDDSVVACDISNLPVEANTVDVAVFSLSLMGTNYAEYLGEAHRILKPMGYLFIAEPQGKWQGKQEELEQEVVKAGFGKPNVWSSGSFLYLKSEKV